MTLEETLEKIHPADKTAMEAALAHWNNIAMPLHSLGRLQDTVVRIAGMTGNARVDLKKKALVVMCADNGVVEEGVTQSGQEVTKIVAENFLKEKATASILCKKAGADIFPVDIGIATDSTILQHKVMYGTKNMAKEPAMTREQAVQALEVGIHMVEELKEKELKRQVKVMDAIREYVTIKTAPYLSKEAIATLISNIEYMACDQPELYKPIRSNIDNPLRSPGLRHLAWNVGERLRVPLAKRAVFIKASFPYELESASHEYLRLNLRDQVASQIPIDVPEKGDYRFHLETDNDES